MSVRNSHTTADYLDWNVMLNLIRKLYRDGDYRMSLFIGCGCFFGLRVSDLRKLTWSMLLMMISLLSMNRKRVRGVLLKSTQIFRSISNSVMRH